MDKIISITPAANGFVALTEQGNLFFGFFVDGENPLIAPKFMWRRIPSIPTILPFTYELKPEPPKMVNAVPPKEFVRKKK